MYNKRLLEFKQSYVIKTYEQSISLENITKSISLLNNNKKKLNQEYNYIYLDLVQVSVKPLTREA